MILNRQNLKQAEEKYLKAKYYYYVIGEPIMLDVDFDKLEELLKENNSKIVELVDFPTIKEIEDLGFDSSNIVSFTKRNEVRYKHLTPYKSLEKIQINDEENIPYSTLTNFFTRINNINSFECSLKYDGNGIELIYDNGVLIQALTRGDKLEGLDKTDKLKHLVPNTISLKTKCQIRGEIVINKELWKRKYYKVEPGKISNPRNFVAGVLYREDYSISEIKDMIYVAYDLTLFDNDESLYVDNTMIYLHELGFNNKYKPTTIVISNVSEFESMYYEMKNHKENSQFLIDGIVIKYPEKFRKILGETNHHPKHSVAIKFPTDEVSTTIIDIEWTLGKNRELTPVGILEPVELNGSMVRRVSLHNMGYIIDNLCFPGAIIGIAKKGEIIPQLTCVIEPSANASIYLKQFENFLN